MPGVRRWFRRSRRVTAGLSGATRPASVLRPEHCRTVPSSCLIQAQGALSCCLQQSSQQIDAVVPMGAIFERRTRAPRDPAAAQVTHAAHRPGQLAFLTTQSPCDARSYYCLRAGPCSHGEKPTLAVHSRTFHSRDQTRGCASRYGGPLLRVALSY
ncbi:hypothetical protein MTO96_013531 [Rhipicephalus appendiculatus]